MKRQKQSPEQCENYSPNATSTPVRQSVPKVHIFPDKTKIAAATDEKSSTILTSELAPDYGPIIFTDGRKVFSPLHEIRIQQKAHGMPVFSNAIAERLPSSEKEEKKKKVRNTNMNIGNMAKLLVEHFNAKCQIGDLFTIDQLQLLVPTLFPEKINSDPDQADIRKSDSKIQSINRRLYDVVNVLVGLSWVEKVNKADVPCTKSKDNKMQKYETYRWCSTKGFFDTLKEKRKPSWYLKYYRPAEPIKDETKADNSVQTLTKKFINLMFCSENLCIDLDTVTNLLKLDEKKRRLYDIANVLRGLEILDKIETQKKSYQWIYERDALLAVKASSQWQNDSGLADISQESTKLNPLLEVVNERVTEIESFNKENLSPKMVTPNNSPIKAMEKLTQTSPWLLNHLAFKTSPIFDDYVNLLMRLESKGSPYKNLVYDDFEKQKKKLKFTD